MVFGTFDLLHPGHHYFLRAAKKRGALTVVVAQSTNVERFKGKKPTQSEQERMHALKQYLPAATILLGEREDFLKLVRSLQPNLILLGYDQKLPPGVRAQDFPCPIERVPPHHPERYKSSLLQPRRHSAHP
jgi:FAD synthetase